MPGAQPATRGPLKKSQPRPRARPTRRDRLMKDPQPKGPLALFVGNDIHSCTANGRVTPAPAAPSATAAHGHVADAPATNPLRPRRPSRRRLRLPRRGPIKADSSARLKPFCVPGQCVPGTIIAGAAATVCADGILRILPRGATVVGGNPKISSGPRLGETVPGTRHHKQAPRETMVNGRGTRHPGRLDNLKFDNEEGHDA